MVRAGREAVIKRTGYGQATESGTTRAHTKILGSVRSRLVRLG